MKALVIGSSGKIGARLIKALRAADIEAIGTTRNELDLLAIPEQFPPHWLDADVVYLCAAKTRFIECEDHQDAYRCNVDAPLTIAQRYMEKRGPFSKVVYLSSEATERALHTNYGMHKALAEVGLRTVGNAVIARIGKVDEWSMPGVCAFLVGLAKAKAGSVHRWSADTQPIPAPASTFEKDAKCECSPHGCRLVDDGRVCQSKCEWLQLQATHA
jgi:dTDP-4-dehydrorhamnose reductase